MGLGSFFISLYSIIMNAIMRYVSVNSQMTIFTDVKMSKRPFFANNRRLVDEVEIRRHCCSILHVINDFVVSAATSVYE